MRPILFIFSGLPGTGKTTLARKLAGIKQCAYIRIDTVEQAMRELCAFNVQGEGYSLSYKIAADNLNLGTSVVADSCNPIEQTRQAWEQTALSAGARFINIEVICSDKTEHRFRVENRISTIERLKLPTWDEVKNRLYHPWLKPRVVVDTAGKSVEESYDKLNRALCELEPFEG